METGFQFRCDDENFVVNENLSSARNCHIRLVVVVYGGGPSLDRSSPASAKRSSGATLARWRV